MKYSPLLFFALFSINNLLHHVSEKVIIVIFITFLFFLMKAFSKTINNEFRAKVEHILNDINMYMNVVFNFLYINKLFYLNLQSLTKNFTSLKSAVNSRVSRLIRTSIFNSKVYKLTHFSTGN